ncbi:MAG: glycoside hydrolase family 99-like domain-containing protein [Ferruginibacter sp.]
MEQKKAKVIAFYLPQFHPIPENDEWWGKGFTEWTNVAKAKALFKGHSQPHVPADLGFYDLRLPEVKEAQAQLAREAGVSAFCYWHYWFGEGKQLLEKPLQDVIKTGAPDFPFCLAWANHSWQKKNWNSAVSRLSKELLIEQKYPGKKDIDDHFYAMLPMFRDKRYYRLHDKLIFVIYSMEDIPEPDYFIERWQQLALENKLPGFYFIGHTINNANINSPLYRKLDAVNLHLLHNAFKNSKYRRLLSWFFHRTLNVIPYSQAMDKWENELLKKDRIYPTIYPNWDTTPRISVLGPVLKDPTPALFKKHVGRILNLISHKADADKVIFLKSWNEWAEGNYMEPDLEYGKGHIMALKEALEQAAHR